MIKTISNQATNQTNNLTQNTTNNKSISRHKLIGGLSNNALFGKNNKKEINLGIDSTPNIIISDLSVLPVKSQIKINPIKHKLKLEDNSIFLKKDSSGSISNTVCNTIMTNINADADDPIINRNNSLSNRIYVNSKINTASKDQMQLRYSTINTQLDDCVEVTERENDLESINTKNNVINNFVEEDVDCNNKSNFNTDHILSKNSSGDNNDINKKSNTSDWGKRSCNIANKEIQYLDIGCNKLDIVNNIDNNINAKVKQEKSRSINSQQNKNKNGIDNDSNANKNTSITLCNSIPFQVGNNNDIQNISFKRQNGSFSKITNINLNKNYREDESLFKSNPKLNSNDNNEKDTIRNNYIANIDTKTNKSKNISFTSKRIFKNTTNLKNSSDSNVLDTYNSININNNNTQINNYNIISNSNTYSNTNSNTYSDKVLDNTNKKNKNNNNSSNTISSNTDRKKNDNPSSTRFNMIDNYDTEINENNFTPKTLKDLKLLSIKKQIALDKRSSCVFIQEDIKINHTLVNLIYKNSILEPFFVRFISVMFKISVVFAMNAIFYTDGYLDALAKAKQEGEVIAFVYYIYNDLIKSIWSSIVTIIICSIMSLIIIVPKGFEVELNNCLVIENSKIIRIGA